MWGFSVALALTPMKDLCKKFFPMKCKVKTIMPVAQASSLWAKLEKTNTVSTGQRPVPLN
jgi:hypothetical protein